MTEEGFLQKDGIGKGSTYKLATKDIKTFSEGVRESTEGVRKDSKGVRFYKKEEISKEILKEIDNIIAPIPNKQRVKKEIMHSLIIEICKYGYFSPELLSKILNRSKDTIKDYISELVTKGELHPYFSSPNSPRQAYTSKRKNNE